MKGKSSLFAPLCGEARALNHELICLKPPNADIPIGRCRIVGVKAPAGLPTLLCLPAALAPHCQGTVAAKLEPSKCLPLPAPADLGTDKYRRPVRDEAGERGAAQLVLHAGRIWGRRHKTIALWRFRRRRLGKQY